MITVQIANGNNPGSKIYSLANLIDGSPTTTGNIKSMTRVEELTQGQ